MNNSSQFSSIMSSMGTSSAQYELVQAQIELASLKANKTLAETQANGNLESVYKSVYDASLEGYNKMKETVDTLNAGWTAAHDGIVSEINITAGEAVKAPENSSSGTFDVSSIVSAVTSGSDISKLVSGFFASDIAGMKVQYFPLEVKFMINKGDLENQSQLEELLAALADKAIKDPDESYSKSPLTEEMLHSQIPAITKTIIDFLKSFCTKFAGYKVKGVEKWYSGRDDKRSWNYTGKIDCILTAGNANPADTGWTIIDYKNTASAMPKQSETRVAEDGSLQDFQIPMYITLIRENEKVKEISLAAFYAINASSSGQKNTVVVDQSNKNKQIEEYESTIQTFVEYAKEFARCVENAAYPLEKVDSFEDCGSCEYKSICRYNYTIAGRTK